MLGQRKYLYFDSALVQPLFLNGLLFFMLLLIILWSRIDNIPRSTLYYDTFTLTRGQRRDDREEDASTENTLQDKKANPTIFHVCTESRWENERKIILDCPTTLFDSMLVDLTKVPETRGYLADVALINVLKYPSVLYPSREQTVDYRRVTTFGAGVSKTTVRK